MTEILERRTRHSKTIDLGGGKRRVEASIAPLHVASDPAAWRRGEKVTWDDPDYSFESRASELSLRRGWYGLEVPRLGIGYLYTSKLRGGTARIELLALDGVVLAATPAPRVAGQEIWWDEVVPGLDIFLRYGVGSVEIFKKIKTVSAPRAFLWRITESQPGQIPIKLATAGHDNADLLEPARTGTGPGRRRRSIVMAQPIRHGPLGARRSDPHGA